jgi:tetratricopeptide (TPR) repeat protein
LSNLAGLHRAQGRLTEAEPLYQRALTIVEQALGPQHPQVAVGLNNLAGLYHAQGRLTEAEPFFQRALTILEQALGSIHPHVAAALNNLAGLYRAQGQYAQAEPLFQRALTLREQALGPAHPDVVPASIIWPRSTATRAGMPRPSPSSSAPCRSSSKPWALGIPRWPSS